MSVEPTEGTDPAILLAKDRGVAIMTFNRPERGNSWSSETSRAYFPMLRALAVDPDVRAIVLTGAGSAFCVGGDGGKLGEVAHSGGPATIEQDDYLAAARSGKPVIAAINGACFGVGLQQILCCDVRIASDEAKFSTAYARRGLPAEFAMSWLLPRIVGVGHAMDLLLSARLVRAAEAERMGLVNRVVPASDLMDEAVGYARDLADRCSPVAMRSIKQQVHADLSSDIAGAYARSAEGLVAAMRSDAFREGVASWREQRPPAFAALPSDLGSIDLDDGLPAPAAP